MSNRDKPPPMASPSSDAFYALSDLLVDRYRQDFPDNPSPPARNRIVVAILGSGASTLSYMPHWPDMKDPVFQRITTGALDTNFFVKEAWDALSASIGHKDPRASPPTLRRDLKEKATLDEICSVASKYSTLREELTRYLQEVYTHPYSAHHDAGPFPQLGYELLAHLLKQRFLDHVINFNFDELFDKALANELPGAYNLVTSEGQVTEALSTNLPLVLKVHGTIREGGSLRFTSRDTGVLSNRIVKLLDSRLFFPAGSGREIPGAIDLISLGYSWQDDDFARWVCARAASVRRILVVRRKPDIPYNLERARANEDAAKHLQIQVLSTAEISRHRQPIPIDYLLWALWETVEQKLREDLELPCIPAARHLVLGSLFGPRTLPGRLRPKRPARGPKLLTGHTLARRYLVELLLHVAKTKGMVSLQVLASDHRLLAYRKQMMARSALLPDTDPFLVEGRHSDLRETYFSRANNAHQLAGQFFDRQIAPEAKVRLPVLREHKIALAERSTRAFLKKQVARILEAPEVEVSPDEDPSALWRFKESVLLPSFQAMQMQTRRIVSEDWTKLFVIAESGEWLTRGKVFESIRRKSGAALYLLTAAPRELKGQWKLRKTIERDLQAYWRTLKNNGLDVLIGELSWWRHNRHLMLALTEKAQGTYRFSGGIYFRRELKESQVSPFLVCSTEDCAELFLVFGWYVRRALEEGGDDNRTLAETVHDLLGRILYPQHFEDRFAHLSDTLDDILGG